MVQPFTRSLLEMGQELGGFVGSLAPLLTVVVLGAGLALLVLYLRDRQGFDGFWQLLRVRAPTLAIGAAVPVVIWMESGLLVTARETLMARMQAEAGSPYSAEAEAPVGTLYQFGPIAAYLQERTFTRTSTLPAQMVPRGVSQQQFEVPTPFMLEPGAYPAKAPRVDVTTRRVGDELVITRRVTMMEEVPITFDQAQVKARFESPRNGRTRRGVRLTFEGRYTFRNPLDTEAMARFVFPLPEPPGTIEGFRLSVGDALVTEPTAQGQYVWQGALPAGATVTATVQFQAVIGQQWFYDVGSGRQRTGEFQLAVQSDTPPRLLRRSLFPTQRRGDTMEWQLQNVITSQQVALAFPVDTRVHETRMKILLFQPVALWAFGAVLALMALLGGLRVGARHVLLAVLGMGFGFLCVPMLMDYLPVFWATVTGTVLATGLSLAALQSYRLVPVVLVAVSPLAFLVIDHSALLLWLLAVAALIYTYMTVSQSFGARRAE